MELPPAILCIGQNYAEHAIEMGHKGETELVLFMKNPASLIANGDSIVIPTCCEDEVDYEGDSQKNQMFHILYDGTVKDEASFAVLGGESEIILDRFESLYKANMTLPKSISACIEALSGDGRKIDPGDLEVAELSIENGRRAFRRITGTELEDLII